MNIKSKQIFLDLYLKQSNQHIFPHSINNRVSSVTKTVSDYYFSDLNITAINEYLLKKKQLIKGKKVVKQHKTTGTKKTKYYFKGTQDKMLISSIIKTPLLLTTELNQKNTTLLTPKRLFKGSHTASGLSNTLKSCNMSQYSKTAKTVGKSCSSSISKKIKTTDSSINTPEMIVSPIFTPLKTKYLSEKKMNFYAQFNLFKRKPSQLNIHRQSLIDRNDAIAHKTRLNSSKTMKRIEVLTVKPFSEEDNDDIFERGLKSDRNNSSFHLRTFKLKNQKKAMKEIENLIDYSESKNYQDEQIEKIQNAKKELLLSRINNSLISKNMNYYKSQYCKNKKTEKKYYGEVSLH